MRVVCLFGFLVVSSHGIAVSERAIQREQMNPLALSPALLGPYFEPRTTDNTGYVAEDPNCEAFSACRGCIVGGCKWSKSNKTCSATIEDDADRVFDIYTCPAAGKYPAGITLPGSFQAEEKCVEEFCGIHGLTCLVYDECITKQTKFAESQGKDDDETYLLALFASECLAGTCEVVKIEPRVPTTCGLFKVCDKHYANQCDECARTLCADSDTDLCLTACYDNLGCATCVENECKKEENKDSCVQYEATKCSNDAMKFHYNMTAPPPDSELANPVPDVVSIATSAPTPVQVEVP